MSKIKIIRRPTEEDWALCYRPGAGHHPPVDGGE